MYIVQKKNIYSNVKAQKSIFSISSSPTNFGLSIKISLYNIYISYAYNQEHIHKLCLGRGRWERHLSSNLPPPPGYVPVYNISTINKVLTSMPGLPLSPLTPGRPDQIQIHYIQ